MAFNMKDDFDADTGNKEVEQFGIWVKKAPEDVDDTTSSDTIQNSTVTSESDDSFNQNDISDTSFLTEDSTELDLDDLPDFDTDNITTDTNNFTADDFSLDALDDPETIQQEQPDNVQAENTSDTSIEETAEETAIDSSFDSFETNEISDSTETKDSFELPESTEETDFTEPIDSSTTDNLEDSENSVATEAPAEQPDVSDSENISDDSFSIDEINTTEDSSEISGEPSFDAPEPQAQESSFQDFQEEDSAENWEPLDDAPNFDYPSVDNITVPPLAEPSEVELESSLQAQSPAEQPKEDNFDEINLTDDSSFDAIETGSTDETDNNLVDFDAEPEAADTDETFSLIDDGFDLPDFGLTPETEEFGNSENAEPIDLTEDLVSPDFGSTPDTEDFGFSRDSSTIDIVGETETEPLDIDFTPPNIEENQTNSDEDDERSPLDEISSEEISSNIDFSTPVDDSELSETNSESQDLGIPDDFDTEFEPASTPDFAETTAEESPATTDFDDSNVIEEASAETEISSDKADSFDIEPLDNFNIPDIAEANNFISAPESKTENTEEELSLDEFLDDGGEIDVSSEFGLSSDSSSDITDDFLSDLNAEFGGSSENKSDVLDEEPIDIDLEFDDQFASEVQTDASENIEDESNFDEFFGDSSGDSGPEVDNFDDMFAAIQDESATDSKDAPALQTDSVSTAEFDEVTEFDDFLSSDSGPDIETEKAHSNKINKQIDYDITVSQDDVNKTKQTTVEVSDDYETSESIPLYGSTTDSDGNKVAFIPQPEDESAPRKASLEKSEDDDFYENLFADAENMDASADSSGDPKDNTPPFSSSSSENDEELIPIKNSTEEQTMKDDQDMNITDKFLSDSPDSGLSEIDDLATSIDDIQLDSDNNSDSVESTGFAESSDSTETDDIIDIPDFDSDFSASDDLSLTESENSENIQIQDAIPEFTDETLNIPETQNQDLNAETAEESFEEPSLDVSLVEEDENLDIPTLSDEIIDEQPAEQPDEPLNVQDDSSIIPTLNEDDEDFVDAAALADSLAETDKLESELDSEPDLAEPLELAEQEEPETSFDDITSSKENSDNDFSSFDDITSDTPENNFIADDSASLDISDDASSISEDIEEENEISNASLYNSILAETFADEAESSNDETDKNLLDITDNTEYTENKEDERNMDFDENKVDSGITNQPTTGVPGQASNISEAVLKEISNELAMLRSEISLLKQELSNVRHESLALHESPAPAEEKVSEEAVPTEETIETEAPVLDNTEETEEAPVVVASETSNGFFDGDVEDETIALSGDELSNILNTADFTEEFVDNTSEESAHDDVTDSSIVPTAPETMDFDEELEAPSDLEIQEIEQSAETEEISVPKVDDIMVGSSEEDNFIDSIEPETQDSISNDELKYLEEEPKDEEIYDAPAEVTEEAASEPESLEVETIDDSTQEAPVEETEEVVLEGDVGPFSEADETPTEAVFEGDQWNEESSDKEVPVEESAEAPAEETAEPAAVAEEPVEAAATSESLVDEGSSIREKAEQFVNEDQKDLKEEIKSVLIYMDQLLENLPDEKIEEFAQSSYFETYKKLFKELGIS